MLKFAKHKYLRKIDDLLMFWFGNHFVVMKVSFMDLLSDASIKMYRIKQHTCKRAQWKGYCLIRNSCGVYV